MTKGKDTSTHSSEEEKQWVMPDPEKLAHNIARIMDKSGELANAFMQTRDKQPEVEAAISEDLSEMGRTFAKVAEKWALHPENFVEKNLELARGWMGLWNHMVHRMAGEETEEINAKASKDKRFQDPDWKEHPFFDFVKHSYLLTADWSQKLIRDTEDLDPHTKQKADFYTRQIMAALSPSNFIFTNPIVLKETLATNGENLVKGLEMLSEDVVTGEGELRIRQTAFRNFEVGKNIGVTPGKVVYRNRIMELIQYAPSTEKVFKRPLIISPPWINKFYILDLAPGKSFVEWLVEQGHPVFMISWVNPDESLKDADWEVYMREGILQAYDVAGEICGSDEINVMGYCVGGTLLSMTLAYLTSKGDNRVKSATFLTTQTDFTHAGELKVFMDEDQITALEAKMEKRGYLHARHMATAFNMLRANELIWHYVTQNYMLGKEPPAFDLLFWNSDSTRIPAANHSYYLRNFYLNNNLTKGKLKLGGVKVDLKNIKCPIYSLATKEDHIAPARSVLEGMKYFNTDIRFVLAGSGHIAGVVNHPAKNKYQHWIGGKAEGDLDAWIENAKEEPGSWWPDWQKWITEISPEMVDAKKPGSKKHKPLEDAPGSYVKMQG